MPDQGPGSLGRGAAAAAANSDAAAAVSRPTAAPDTQGEAADAAPAATAPSEAPAAADGDGAPAAPADAADAAPADAAAAAVAAIAAPPRRGCEWPTFSDDSIEEQFQVERQAGLARQDAFCGVLLFLCGAAWALRISVHRPCDTGVLLRVAAVTACGVLPAVMYRTLGLRRYARCRRGVALLLRLSCLASPTSLGVCLLKSPRVGAWHTASRLFLASRGVRLAVAPLAFRMAPLCTLLTQVAATAVAMRSMPTVCSSDCFAAPAFRESLARLAVWLSYGPTLFPLPHAELAPDQNACVLLAHWLQICWLCVLPCLLVWHWHVKARCDFALALPRGTLPRGERLWWASAAGANAWQLPLLLVPAFSQVLWCYLVLGCWA